MEVFLLGCLSAFIYMRFIMPRIIEKLDKSRNYKSLDSAVMPHVIIILTLIIGSILLTAWIDIWWKVS